MNSSDNKKISAFIFDWDGTLCDTEKFFDAIIQDYSTHMTGAPLSEEVFNNLRSNMFGRKKEESRKLFYEALNINPEHLSPEDDYLIWRHPRLQKLFPGSDLLPGAEKIVFYGKQNNIPMAIASSSSREYFILKAQKHQNILDMMQVILLGEDTPEGKGKPHPAIFLLAAEKLSVPAEECLVFEDAPSGVQAAKGAGMSVVVTPHPMLDRNLIREADQILESLEDFKPGEWGV